MNDGWALSFESEHDIHCIDAGTRENTRRPYQSHINHFFKVDKQLPASTKRIVGYLKECALDYSAAPNGKLLKMNQVVNNHVICGGGR